MLRFFTVIYLTLTALPVMAQDTRTIIDHAGYEVTYPVDPQRIVSLHDWTVTVMARELDANLVGSTGRVASDGSYFIRSARELFGLSFDDIEMASVHGQLDMERIAALKPDLIIGNLGDTLDYRDQLASIAPTIIFDPMNGRAALENYAEFADWVARSEKFKTLQAAYKTRIDTLRPQLIPNGKAPSYVIIIPNTEDGVIRLFRTYGAQSQVLDDLGFQVMPVVNQVPAEKQDAAFSPEIVGQLNADWIFTSHITDNGETKTDMAAALERIAPGASGFLVAIREGHFVSSDRFYVYPTAFAAMNYVLDELEQLIAAK